MKLLPHIVYTTGLVISVWFGCQTYLTERAEHELAENVRAEHYATTAKWNASAARFEAITAQIELENKRTQVETNIRGVVMAEYRRCAKGRCK